MKKASRFLKQLFSAIVAAVRESSAAMRSKTSAVRTRLIFLGILRNRKLLMSSISSKIHALVAGAAQAQAQQHGNNNNNNGAGLVAARGKKKAAVLQSLPSFAADDQDRRRAAAVLLLNSLPSFADVFIRRFHDQMKLQKLDSFKRFCEMLDRN